jgi:hypothetical protein
MLIQVKKKLIQRLPQIKNKKLRKKSIQIKISIQIKTLI